MMMNIFVLFDFMWFNAFYKTLPITTLMLMMYLTTFWYIYPKMSKMMFPLLSFIMSQLMMSKSKKMKGLLLIISSLFIFLTFMNILGMLPYLFSMTSHIIFTLSLGLPLWSTSMMSSIEYSMKKTASHLLPDSTPPWLSPFLILIESASIIIRPMTLSFRLAANMTAGHVILTLISSFSNKLNMKTFLTMTMMSSMYITFELGICMVQAYIFCLLMSLYTNDHV